MNLADNNAHPERKGPTPAQLSADPSAPQLAAEALALFRATFAPGPRQEDFARNLARWRGHAPSGGERLMSHVPDGFKLQDAWCREPYRYVWVNGTLGAVITYTEGDVIVEQAWHAAAWARLLMECASFYAQGRP